MISINVTDEEYMEMARVAELAPPVVTPPDQWLDWGDVTVQIDPVGNKQWIVDDSTETRHRLSEERGRGYDTRDVVEVQKLLNKPTGLSGVRFSLPTVAQLDAIPNKYSEPMGAGCRSWRGVQRKSDRFGKFPVIEAQWRDGLLQDKSTGQIAAEMLGQERVRGHRLFDTESKVYTTISAEQFVGGGNNTKKQEQLDTAYTGSQWRLGVIKRRELIHTSPHMPAMSVALM